MSKPPPLPRTSLPFLFHFSTFILFKCKMQFLLSRNIPLATPLTTLTRLGSEEHGEKEAEERERERERETRGVVGGSPALPGRFHRVRKRKGRHDRSPPPRRPVLVSFSTQTLIFCSPLSRIGLEIQASRSAFCQCWLRLGVGAAVIDYDNHDADVAKSREGQATLARSVGGWVEEADGKKERRKRGGMEWQVGGREGRVGLSE